MEGTGDYAMQEEDEDMGVGWAAMSETPQQPQALVELDELDDNGVWTQVRQVQDHKSTPALLACDLPFPDENPSRWQDSSAAWSLFSRTACLLSESSPRLSTSPGPKEPVSRDHIT